MNNILENLSQKTAVFHFHLLPLVDHISKDELTIACAVLATIYENEINIEEKALQCIFNLSTQIAKDNIPRNWLELCILSLGREFELSQPIIDHQLQVHGNHYDQFANPKYEINKNDIKKLKSRINARYNPRKFYDMHKEYLDISLKIIQHETNQEKRLNKTIVPKQSIETKFIIEPPRKKVLTPNFDAILKDMGHLLTPVHLFLDNMTDLDVNARDLKTRSSELFR